jgi:EAL domain-containing protein (putative c-di-GMP-specific phosphodiesterase class I)
LLKPVDPQQLVEVTARAVRMHKLADVKRQAKAYLDSEHEAEHRTLSKRFSRALVGLELAFQPIVRWAQKKLVAYEALLRTNEPSFTRPEKLVAAAETLGRVHELGRAIRNRAAQRMQQRSEMRLFVNLHSEELLDEDLYDPKAPLSLIAKRTVLEITERAGLDRVRDVRARLDRLRRLGFSVAIDDLGAGYSGLNSFVELDPQYAKLDIALVRDVHREPMKWKLIRTITSLCNELDITVLAEGIECREERDALEGLGCDWQQGFLFARPAVAFPAVHW